MPATVRRRRNRMRLWGGRFEGTTDERVAEFTRSIEVDRALALDDIAGSIAHVHGLGRADLLAADEVESLVHGLEALRGEVEAGEIVWDPALEDVHMNLEVALRARVGPVAGKLHTGRSRNDQVATDFRLWMLQSLPAVQTELESLQSELIARAEEANETLMPGYTHVQRAQPILLAHWWLSNFWALERDCERLKELAKRISVMPLGSGALAGTPIAIDREALAKALHFRVPSPNSLDAVSDRDFAAEFLFCAALTGVHLSKLSEQIVLYTSAEFGFFELSDAFSTGSSLMPQKKNPDVFELTRGKSGVLIGQLVGMLSVLKGLPSTYDKDLQ